MSAIELFACEPYACRLTRSACAQRHESAQRAGRPSPVAVPPSLRWSLCRTCEVGAAHARGERPDVDAAALVRREEVEVGKTYTNGFQTLTLEGWAKTPEVAALGLSAQALRSRIEHGWTLADALSTPKGAPRPGTSATKKSTKPRDEEPRKKSIVSPRKRAPMPVPELEEASAEQVRETLTALSPADLLTRLGYVVEDAGLVPAGRLLLLRGAA